MKDRMHGVIRNFAKQFSFAPKIENLKKLKRYEHFIVAGMGGSHLAGDLIKTLRPNLDVIIHFDYGLPHISKDRHAKTLIIASSYSGNTEETIDAFEEAGKRGLARAAISIGGELLRRAGRAGAPYVQLPNWDIQPRSALGLSIKAILALLKEQALLREAGTLAQKLDPGALEVSGRALAKKLKYRTPIIYASRRNGPVAYNWKIKFNETGKVPAFWNVLPELNHNEMTSFDATPSTRKLSKQFSFVFLKDDSDDRRIIKRMAVLKNIFMSRGLSVHIAELRDKTELEKIFSSLVLADWAAYYTAHGYGLDAEEVPMVEEFKKLIK